MTTKKKTQSTKKKTTKKKTTKKAQNKAQTTNKKNPAPAAEQDKKPEQTTTNYTRAGRKPNEWTLLRLGDLKNYKTNNGFSIKRLSEMIGCSQATMNNWLQGRSAPTQAKQKVMRDLIDGKNVPVHSEEEKRQEKAKDEQKGNQVARQLLRMAAESDNPLPLIEAAQNLLTQGSR